MRIHHPARRDRKTYLPAAAAVLALALTAAACGGGAATGDPSTVSSPPATPSATAATATAHLADPTTATVEVGREAWFAGFHLSFGTATAELQSGRGGTVTIETTFENAGDEEATLDATLNLASGGDNARAGIGMDIPSVPGGTSGRGVLAFEVANSFRFEDAVLTLGRSANQQAIVPLTPGAGTAVTLEPVAVTASGHGKAGDLRLDLSGGEVRADSPWKHGEMASGSLVLTLGYAATFDSGFAGGFAFSAENVALRLPDGTTVGVIQDGKSQSIELIGPRSTVRNLLSRFEIADPAAGEYVLLVRSFDNAEDEIPFTIG